MYPSTVCFALLGALGAVAAPIGAKDVAEHFMPEAKLAGPLRLPVRRHAVDTRESGRLARRDGSNHTAPFTNSRNQLWTIPVQIGTPPQDFDVVLDTGSNGLWVFDKTCTDNCPSTPGFDRSNSSTYKSENMPFQQVYVVTDISGVVGKDTVTVGGYSVQQQEFGVMTGGRADPYYKGRDVNGILGMSWPVDGELFPSSPGFWINALGQWPEPQFGIELRSLGSGVSRITTSSEGGTLTLGGVDTDAFDGELHYVSKLNGSSWSIAMDALIVNGASVSSNNKRSGGELQAMVDSGTTGLMGPLDAVRTMFTKIPGAYLDTSISTAGTLEYYRYPCDADMDVEVEFGGTPYKLNNDDLWMYSGRANGSSTTDTCVSNVFGWNEDHWVVGAAFFNSVYVAFRHDPPAIGFAPLKAASNATA